CIRARRLGVLGHFWQHFRPESETQVWTLPNGKTAEQVGGRCSDLVLAWAEDEVSPLDESRIKSRWPQSRGIQKIAENLYLVRGVELREQRGSEETTAPLPAPESPVRQAEEMLAAARRSGDRRQTASALTDL